MALDGRGAVRPDGGEGVTKRPNVLLVLSDQHRASATGCYGNPDVRTPRLDAFAAQGVRVETAVATTPVCGPSRACLMTGSYAHRCGYLTNELPFRPHGPCLAEVFRAAGYACGYVGKWHLHFPTGANGNFVPPDARHGFADFWAAFNGQHRYHRWQLYRGENPVPQEIVDYQPEVEVDLALEFVEQQQRAGRPWLLVLAWGPPHTPFDPPPGYAEHYADVSVPPDVPEGQPAEYAKRTLPAYYGLVESLDVAFGRLLAGVDRLQATGDTVVAYTSDHGEMMGAHGYRGNKRWPYAAALRVPLLVRWPGRIPAGRVTADPVCIPDLFPTLADLAGLAPPAGLDGRSRSTALLGAGADDSGQAVDGPPGTPEFVLCSMPYGYVPWPGWRAIRSARYLYARTRQDPWLLYDYAADPWEQHNLVQEKGQRSLREELDAALTAMMVEAGDSWDLATNEGDWRNWLPGSQKMKHNDLGVPWPGSGIRA